jgi:hypothetical protein
MVRVGICLDAGMPMLVHEGEDRRLLAQPGG